MQLEFDRAELFKAFKVVSSLVPRASRKGNPALQCVRIRSLDSKVFIYGTDGETGVCHALPMARVHSDVDFLVPAKLMATVLKEMSNSFVRLEVKAGDVRVWDDVNEFVFALQDMLKFPEIKSFEERACYRFSANDLKTAIRRTVYATDSELSSRYALSGILFDFSGKRVVMVATDARRLAMMSMATGKKGKPKIGKANPVVPAKAMRLVGSIIHKSDELVFVAIQENYAIFKIGDASIASQLIDGRFPKYQDVIPKSFTATIPLQADLFRSVIRRANIMTSSENRGADFFISQGALRVTSGSSTRGHSRIDVPVSYDGSDVVARFDSRFIADFLKPLDSDTPVNFQVQSADTAGMVTTDDGYACLIMPLSRD